MDHLHFTDACTGEHFAAMSLLHALGWRSTYSDAIPADYIADEITDERWIPFFHADYETGRCRGLLLCRDDTPVACATYGPARMGPGPAQNSLVSFRSEGYEGWGEIISFYTQPDEKRRGYGSLLMDEVLRRLREHGFPGVYLMVLRENEGARRFYAHHGFSWDGTREDIVFPHDTVCVDLRYTRAL